jgi:hypothetical protein
MCASTRRMNGPAPTGCGRRHPARVRIIAVADVFEAKPPPVRTGPRSCRPGPVDDRRGSVTHSTGRRGGPRALDAGFGCDRRPRRADRRAAGLGQWGGPNSDGRVAPMDCHRLHPPRITFNGRSGGLDPARGMGLSKWCARRPPAVQGHQAGPRRDLAGLPVIMLTTKPQSGSTHRRWVSRWTTTSRSSAPTRATPNAGVGLQPRADRATRCDRSVAVVARPAAKDERTGFRPRRHPGYDKYQGRARSACEPAGWRRDQVPAAAGPSALRRQQSFGKGTGCAQLHREAHTSAVAGRSIVRPSDGR